jgi:UDP-N-acetylmuramate--alanine ligase
VVSDIVTEPRRCAFDLVVRDGSTIAISLAVGGLHNVANAAVAASMADLAGFSHDAIVEGLGAFGGVARRYEQRGVVRGVTLIDDYAHLPTEVATTVTAACSSGFSKVIVVFQPHRYTRTQHVGAQFGSSFDGADVVVVTPLYAAGEAAIAGVSSAIVSNAVREDGSVAQVIDVESLEEASEVAAGLATHGSVILTLGAGDSTSLPDLVAAMLEEQ